MNKMQSESLSWKNRQISFKGDKKDGFFFVCHKCDAKFASTRVLKDHTCEQHSKIQDYEKTLMEVDNFKEEPLKSAMVTQSQTDSDERTIKLENDTGQEDLFFNCKSCGRYLRSSKSFEEHMDKHRQDVQIPCQDKNGCNETFFTASDLRKHMLEVHEIVSSLGEIQLKCPKCKFTGTKNSVKRHLKLHDETKNFTCSECGKAFKNKIGYQCHVKNHNGILDFPCEKCDKKYVSKSALRGHILQKHDIQTFVCNLCGAVFKLKMLYTNHMRGHTGEKTYKCREEDCGKWFRNYEVRKNHERSHKGVKEFACHQCGKTMMRKYSLKLHMKIHQGKLDYKCSECGKGFVDSKGAKKCKHSGKTSSRTLT